MSDDADGEEDPLGGLADEVARRRESEETEPDVFDEAFEEMDFDVDSEAVWERLTEGERPEMSPEGEERVVDKRSFCHRCEYFSDPPDIACGHEGTEIIELADVNHFLVKDCPVVAERDRLEGMD
ncbi:MAG: hypothetical protein ABEJ68_04285 [Halobacteriaceae archaeon]